jgi:CRP-like cAMP-binding protein
MLSTLEKTIMLNKAGVFAETPGEALAAVAALLEEVHLGADETIFEAGDLGDCMYVIVKGRVRVHDQGRTLNHLDAGEIFGEMALLDPEPRMASVTAVANTHLLRLDQEPFYELLEDRPEVVRGIIRVLCQRLRARAGALGRTGPAATPNAMP